ncbi:MAG: hypothetical protein KAJ19_12420 [Gammaproteobacteria bacterium]|nr:hypothetical protein [Gammaproteobacteria bacterium]
MLSLGSKLHEVRPDRRIYVDPDELSSGMTWRKVVLPFVRLLKASGYRLSVAHGTSDRQAYAFGSAIVLILSDGPPTIAWLNGQFPAESVISGVRSNWGRAKIIAGV